MRLSAEASGEACAFPGAAVEPCGAERVFFGRHETEMRPVLERAARIAGLDLLGFLERDDLRFLRGRPRQVFTFAFGLAVHQVYRAERGSPAILAGHSLGVYAAAAASGALSLEDALAALDSARVAARRAAGGWGFAMASIVGLPRAEVLALGDRCGGDVRVAIVHNAAAFVLTGPASAVDAAVDAAIEAGALRAGRIDDDAPYHHPGFLAIALREFEASLAALRWSEPCVPLVSTLDGTVLDTADAIRRYTALNLAEPIDWERTMRVLAGRGVRRIFECGPGDALSRIGRFLDAGPSWSNIRRWETDLR